MGIRVEIIDALCDRCGEMADRVIPFRLSESIVYYNRVIHKPWLCLNCLRIEKEKWWDAHRFLQRLDQEFRQQGP